MTKSYSDVIQLPTFEERLLYLQTHGQVGLDTFGPYRYLVERFLQSREWKRIKRDVIVRDNCCDLAMPDRPINSKVEKVFVHHINPCTVEDIVNQRWEIVMNPENLITTRFQTHQQIHYGSSAVVQEIYKERKPGDTCPWR